MTLHGHILCRTSWRNSLPVALVFRLVFLCLVVAFVDELNPAVSRTPNVRKFSRTDIIAHSATRFSILCFFFLSFSFFSPQQRGVGWPERRCGASALSFPTPTIPRTPLSLRLHRRHDATWRTTNGVRYVLVFPLSYPSPPPFRRDVSLPPHVANVLVLLNIPLFLCGCFDLWNIYHTVGHAIFVVSCPTVWCLFSGFNIKLHLL